MRDLILGGRYRITEPIGSGGMAVVYKGEDILLNRTVTVKILRDQYASDQAFIRRFRQEAQAVARLSHPNIVSIYDVGEEGSYHYLVMEYVPGGTLKDLIRDRAPLPVGEAIGYLLQLLEALEHAHANGIVHCDIKPHNLLVTPAGRIKITDFGLARAATEATITFPGSIVGSVHYLSPEQAKGEPATVRSDLYSLSVVFFEMLTGRTPFQGETPLAVAMQHLQATPPSPRSFNPDIPPALERIVLKGLAKDPADRYATAAEMRSDLEKVFLGAEEPTRVLPSQVSTATVTLPTTQPEEDPVPTRRRLRWWVAPLLVAIILYGLYSGWQIYWRVSEVEVPAVVGLPLDEAQRVLVSTGLRWQVGEKRHDPRVEEGVVLEQDPAAHERVKRFRVVTLDVSLGPALTQVPPVAGLTERAARLALEEARLKVSPDRQEVYDEQTSAGTVVRTVPPAGSSVAEGSEIILVVSLGPKPKPVTVPDLVGRSLEEAKKELERVGLNLGQVIRASEENSEFFAGTVIDQRPKPQTAALAGDKVELIISPGPGPPARTALIENILVPNDGRTHRVRVVISDAKGQGREVYDRQHSPGETVSVTVTFYGHGSLDVYLDDQPYLLNHPLEG
ncbi:MAG: protein kinase domain-containing protein [Moorellales bacterium]